jgi:hypothetical protein
VDRIHVAPGRVHWRAFVNKVVNLRVGLSVLLASGPGFPPVSGTCRRRWLERVYGRAGFFRRGVGGGAAERFDFCGPRIPREQLSTGHAGLSSGFFASPVVAALDAGMSELTFSWQMKRLASLWSSI